MRDHRRFNLKNRFSVLTGAMAVLVGFCLPALAKSADEVVFSVASVGRPNTVFDKGSTRTTIEFKDSTGNVVATHVVESRDGGYPKCYVERLGQQYVSENFDCDLLPQKFETLIGNGGREVEVTFNNRKRFLTAFTPSETKVIFGNPKLSVKTRTQNLQNAIVQIINSATCDSAETIRKEGQSIFADNPKMDDGAKTTVRNQMDGLKKLCPPSDAPVNGNGSAKPVTR